MRPNFLDFDPYRWRGTCPPKDECSASQELAELLRAFYLWFKRIHDAGHGWWRRQVQKPDRDRA